MTRKRPQTREEVRSVVFEIIEEWLNVPQDKISEDKTFSVSFNISSGTEGEGRNEMGADSLDVTQLVLEFEDSFDIQIPNEDIDGLRTVGVVIGYICRKLGIEDEPPAASIAA